MFNVISSCIQMGQAAGTAAALAVKTQVRPRHIDIKALQQRLAAQGVELPQQTQCASHGTNNKGRS